MRPNRLIVLVVVLLASLAASARDTRKELVVNLAFTPQEGVEVTSADLPPAVLERPVSLAVEDGRAQEARATIGQGTNDDDDTFPVRASGELVPYLTATTREIATGWGVKLSDSADRVLTLRPTRFFVDEGNKAVGSVYAAEVKFTYVLSDRRGKKLAEGAASGSAHRYGRARSVDNCNEVLSDALKEAFANVVADSRLQQAWSTGRSTGATGGGDTQSIEERLKKLDELLKKKMITKEEYNRKRAEILKDV